MIIEAFKEVGLTTVEFTEKYKKTNNINKICFAGRLDPLAYGKLYLLTDNDVYLKEEYCNKKKIYESYIIKNIITDTYDIMGIPKISNKIEENIPISCKFKQKYPPYSSVIIKKYKKPFWLVSKLNLELDELDIPTKEVEIEKLEYIEKKYINPNDLLDLIINRINKINVSQDFRQNIVIQKWKNLLENYKNNIEIIKIRAIVSSGTYIRNIGNMLNGCCYDIHRIEYI